MICVYIYIYMYMHIRTLAGLARVLEDIRELGDSGAPSFVW